MNTTIKAKDTFHASMRKYARLKRFFERFSADPDFMNNLKLNFNETLEKNHIKIDREDVRYLFEKENSETPEAVIKMWNIVQNKQRWVEQFYLNDCLPSKASMLSWRKRQIERQRYDLGPFFTNTNIHSSLAVELSQGCSVGCWFCALSPDSLKNNYSHETNQEEWIRFIQIMNSFLGNAIKSTFLYWATEPFDNPYYEKFCIDLYNETGVFPPTTTAVAHKDIDRIKQFLKLSSDYGTWLNRFSLTSLGIMRKVHKNYTEEELAEVECLPLNKKANYAYGNSGNFRERTKADPNLLAEQDEKLRTAPWHHKDSDYNSSEDYANGSICCVSGFLVNMVSRKIQLISPTTATDEWPLGYIIFDEAKFENIEELQIILNSWEERFFKSEMDLDDFVAFYPWIHTRFTENEVILKGRFNQKKQFSRIDDPVITKLIELITNTKSSFKEIQAHALEQFDISLIDSKKAINTLFSYGFISEK
ncbi:radical SAM family RiPP maturation amino acid epimerase [Tenacibaculum amylolyticum]|uniref:radical SAM family RiPP maturation amino acid epimerase n=1 Tax=Tenacibaculum amylolyticum TaxID=104269 RepID=UPI0038948305